MQAKFSTSYMPQMDSLRAFAAIAVLLHHFLRDFNLADFNAGAYGVQLFFVISGFLITKILLERKSRLATDALASLGSILKRFYIRRGLRLFPIYYLFISGFLILSLLTGLWVWNSGSGIWFYTYTANFLFFFHGMQGIQVNHLWTLAVEEQFYFIWPLILLLVPEKHEKIVMILFVFFGLLFKVVAFFFIPNPYVSVLPLYHFDTLGSGALLAWLSLRRQALFVKRISPWIIASLFALWIVSMFFSKNIPEWVNNTILPVLVCILFSLFVQSAAIGVTGFVGKIFNFRFLQFVGRISYGIYIYHKPVPYFLKILIGNERMYSILPAFAWVIISLLFTLIIASLSWYIIEKPISRIKEKFI